VFARSLDESTWVERDFPGYSELYFLLCFNISSLFNFPTFIHSSLSKPLEKYEVWPLLCRPWIAKFVKKYSRSVKRWRLAALFSQINMYTIPFKHRFCFFQLEKCWTHILEISVSITGVIKIHESRSLDTPFELVHFLNSH
jgi:hypothetical protein